MCGKVGGARGDAHKWVFFLFCVWFQDGYSFRKERMRKKNSKRVLHSSGKKNIFQFFNFSIPFTLLLRGQSQTGVNNRTNTQRWSVYLLLNNTIL